MNKEAEINKELIKVLEEKIQLLEEQKVISQKIIDIQKEQLTLTDVVVPKGTLCECKKHSLKTNYGFEICTKCGNEFDD